MYTQNMRTERDWAVEESATEHKRGPEIDAELQMLQKEVERLGGVASVLEERLHPVMASMAQPEQTDAISRDSITPLGGALSDVRSKLVSASNQLAGFLDRLEV